MHKNRSSIIAGEFWFSYLRPQVFPGPLAFRIILRHQPRRIRWRGYWQQNGFQNAIEFVDVLKRAGARLEPTMVNFVGAHNPDAGAFFIFEIVTLAGGDSLRSCRSRGLDLGHFTAATNDGRLISNQSGLVIELIAWIRKNSFTTFMNWPVEPGSTVATPKTFLTIYRVCTVNETASLRSAGGCVVPDATSTAASCKRS